MEQNQADYISNQLEVLAEVFKTQAENLPEEMNINFGHSWYNTSFQTDEVPEQMDAVIKAFKGTGATIQKVWQDTSLVVYIAFPKDQETKEKFINQIEKYDFPLGCNDVLYWKLWADREIVCTKRVIGTETVEVEKLISRETETVEEEREIVEWDCHPLLGVK